MLEGKLLSPTGPPPPPNSGWGRSKIRRGTGNPFSGMGRGRDTQGASPGDCPDERKREPEVARSERSEDPPGSFSKRIIIF